MVRKKAGKASTLSQFILKEDPEMFKEKSLKLIKNMKRK